MFKIAYRLRRAWYVVLFSGLAAWAFAEGAATEPPPSPAARSDEIALQVVKYADLIAAVKAKRGKVIVVDVWAEY